MGWVVGIIAISFLVMILLLILPAIWSSKVIKRSGYPGILGFFLGLFLSFFGVLIAYLLPPTDMYSATVTKNKSGPPTAAPVKSKSRKDKKKQAGSRFLVGEISFSTYESARQYCLDRNISVQEIQVLNY